MGGEATPGLGAPEEEELLGRVSRDLALCMPEPCAELLLPAPFASLFAPTCPMLAALRHQRQADTCTDIRDRQTQMYRQQRLK